MSHYNRIKHTTTNVDTGEQEHHKSINAAKRKSRELQKAGHTVTVPK